MEKLLLGSFLVRNELDIVHKENIGSPVPVPEFTFLSSLMEFIRSLVNFSEVVYTTLVLGLFLKYSGLWRA